MAKLRSVNTAMWVDGFIVNLDPVEKLLFTYLLINPFTRLSGCYEISVRQIAFDTGIDQEMVLKIIGRFETAKKMIYRDGWLVLLNFLKNQNLNDNMKKCVVSELAEAPVWVNQTIVTVVESSQSLSKAFEGFRILRKVEVEDEVEREVEKETEAASPEACVLPLLEIHVGEIQAGVMKELGLKKLSVSEQRDWANHATLAFENEQTADEFLETFSLLRSQKWRTGVITPETVRKNIPNIGKIKEELQNGKPKSEREKSAERGSNALALVAELRRQGAEEQALLGGGGGTRPPDTLLIESAKPH